MTPDVKGLIERLRSCAKVNGAGACHDSEAADALEAMEKEVAHQTDMACQADVMCQRYKALVKELAVALGKVDAWFERMAKDQHEKLVENQTFESASANWGSLLNEPLDMAPIKAALAKVPEELK